MDLLKCEFDILTYLEGIKQPISELNISQNTKYTVEEVKYEVKQLKRKGYISDENIILSKGIEALEPYRVTRAILIAAGLGSRMTPITINTPKPLVRVKGKRIIDTLLDAIIKAGIKEIFIVRGYLGEQFDQLIYKYPQIRFVENHMFDKTNNISSIMCSRSLLQNTYVLEADLYLYNSNLITKYQYESNYLGIPVEKTDDWCFIDDNDYITKVQIGGSNCYQMVGISYWTRSDGAKLKEHIRQVYKLPRGKELYWDEVPLKYFINEYKIKIRKCSFDDIVEIDSYEELKQLDHLYK